MLFIGTQRDSNVFEISLVKLWYAHALEAHAIIHHLEFQITQSGDMQMINIKELKQDVKETVTYIIIPIVFKIHKYGNISKKHGKEVHQREH